MKRSSWKVKRSKISFWGAPSVTLINMHLFTIVSAVTLGATIATALPTNNTTEASCTEIQIPLTISELRFPVNATIRDNWDAVALAFNLTSKDFNTPNDPLLIASGPDTNVTSNYTVAASLCGTGSTVIVTTHGIVESKWCGSPSPFLCFFFTRHKYAAWIIGANMGQQVLSAKLFRLDAV